MLSKICFSIKAGLKSFIDMCSIIRADAKRVSEYKTEALTWTYDFIVALLNRQRVIND